jgi:acyl carrier protein
MSFNIGIKEKRFMANDTFGRVQAIIVEQLGVENDEVTMEASFRDDLEADSLDLVELIMAFEEEFGGEISDDEAQNLTTVGDVVNFLNSQAT